MDDGSRPAGYLMKQGGLRKNWKRRYFWFSHGGRQLNYSEKEQTKAKVLGSIVFKDESVVFISGGAPNAPKLDTLNLPPLLARGQGLFHIFVTGRLFNLSADTTDKRSEWVNAISMTLRTEFPNGKEARVINRQTMMPHLPVDAQTNLSVPSTDPSFRPHSFEERSTWRGSSLGATPSPTPADHERDRRATHVDSAPAFESTKASKPAPLAPTESLLGPRPVSPVPPSLSLSASGGSESRGQHSSTSGASSSTSSSLHLHPYSSTMPSAAPLPLTNPARITESGIPLELAKQQLLIAQNSLSKANSSLDEHIRRIAILEEKLRSREAEVDALQEEAKSYRRELAQKDELLRRSQGAAGPRHHSHDGEAQMAHQSHNAFLSSELSRCQRELSTLESTHHTKIADLQTQLAQRDRELERLTLERKFLTAKLQLDLTTSEEYRSFRAMENHLEETRRVTRALTEKYFHSLAVMAKVNASNSAHANNISISELYERASKANISWENFPTWIAQQVREELSRQSSPPPPSSASSHSSRHISAPSTFLSDLPRSKSPKRRSKHSSSSSSSSSPPATSFLPDLFGFAKKSEKQSFRRDTHRPPAEISFSAHQHEGFKEPTGNAFIEEFQF